MKQITAFFNRLWVSALCLSLFFAPACNDNSNKTTTNTADTGRKQPDKPLATSMDTSLLTIAGINEAADGKNMEIRFYERAAVYTIDKNDRAFSANNGLLNEALKTNNPIKLVANRGNNAISNFMKATDAELKAYNTGSGLNSPDTKIKSEAPIAIDLAKIDTSIFNRVDRQLKFPIFKLCTNVVPDYATLVNIFNYCAGQGCNKPGPYAITNCIPFQYVRDGCYARAHKMRQMITSKFGYCCEKVFSYAQPYPKVLAVKANMWGGCCVEWWYHVVPLLRLNVKFGKQTIQVCYVIDPGMFTTPVTLSTWLNAQKNTTCNANATVTSYSIQPGTAYAPAGGGYSTDPNLTATEQTLINYKNLVTCN
jgi:Glutaminase